MAQGGFRVGSGRPQDPQALDHTRRLRTGGTALPTAGRTGKAPAWPLTKNAAQEKMWARLWRKPQAVQWEHLGLEDQAAAYVVAYTDSVAPGAPAALKTAVLRMEDSLGISPSGLAALRWRIEATPVEEHPAGPVIDARSRFQLAVEA